MSPAAAGWLEVRTSAAVAGRFVALEQDLHRRLGVLAGVAEPPAARCFLAEASLAHGWRAGLFEALLPVSIGLPGAADLVVLPRADAERHARVDAAGDPVALLLAEVYPRVAEGYEATAAAVSPVSDGPLALAARRAAADLRRTIVRGSLLQGDSHVSLPRRPLYGPLRPRTVAVPHLSSSDTRLDSLTPSLH